MGVRRFEGTNILIDSTYLGPSYLRRSQNWVPGETFRLEKRTGTAAYGGGDLPGTVTQTHLIRSAEVAGDALFFAVARDGASDTVFVSVNNAAWGTVNGSSMFTTQATRYDMEIVNQFAFVGNGIDPIKRIDLSTLTAVNLLVIAAFTDGSADATLVDDPGSQILTGTYAYCWCIFDVPGKIWVQRSQTREVTKRQITDQAITFPFPTGMGPLGATLKAHLFVAPVDYPIEFAHDQTTAGATIGDTTLRTVVADGPPVPLRGAARTGSIMRTYYGRLVIAGDQNATDAVWCSSTLAPGNEQPLFDAGIFWPHNGRLPRAPEAVTGLGLAGPGERESSVQSPLIVLTLTRTYLWYGDVLDDPSAQWVLASRRAGCISAASVAETPYGVLYCGLESVYMIPTGGAVPVDVGWPIRPAIQAIAFGARSRVTALYHKGFYKLAVVPPGAAQATQQWWLDLRRGQTAVPSWFGPHLGVPVSAWASTPYDAAQADLGIHAIATTNVTERIAQPNSYHENHGASTIVSVLQTGDLDDGAPFDRKLFTMLRSIGFPVKTTTVTVSAMLDGGLATSYPALLFQGVEGAIWNVSEWNTASWGQIAFTEAQSTSRSRRPRGRTISLQLSHAEPIGLALRDIEVTYIPIPRLVRSVPEDANS